MREAQAVAQLSHENVIVVHEVGTHEGQVYLAMEYIAGGTLTRWQAGRAWRECLDAFCAPAADSPPRTPRASCIATSSRTTCSSPTTAVCASPTSGSSRRSMRRATRRYHRRARRQSSRRRSRRRARSLGTPRYMAPEQYRADPVDARADQFAFCAALYEAVYRQPAFAGTTLAELSARSSRAPCSPRRLRRAGCDPRCDLARTVRR